MAAKKKEASKKSVASEETARNGTRVPTYIKGFDELAQGGVKEKSINLIVGGTGSGKTIFAIQFLINGIINSNEAAMYITFEERKEKLYSDMRSIGYDLGKHEKSGKFIFLEYSPEQVKKVLIEGGGLIEEAIIKYKVKRLVIDSITSFALLYKDELTRKEAALSIFDLINEWGCTAILTSQQPNRADTQFISSSLEFEVDSLILLYNILRKGHRDRALEILKMRGTAHPQNIFSMEIKDGGIAVNPDRIMNIDNQ